MPFSARNTRQFQFRLYAGILKEVLLLKRSDDQNSGTQIELTLRRVRRSRYVKTGQPIAGEETSDERCVFHIPAIELERVGVKYINALDRIIETRDDLLRTLKPARYWQPESTTSIETKMMENEVDVACLRIDPPVPAN